MIIPNADHNLSDGIEAILSLLEKYFFQERYCSISISNDKI